MSAAFSTNDRMALRLSLLPGETEIDAKTEAVIRSNADIDAVRTAVDELIELIRGVQGYDAAKEKRATHA